MSEASSGHARLSRDLEPMPGPGVAPLDRPTGSLIEGGTFRRVPYVRSRLTVRSTLAPECELPTGSLVPRPRTGDVPIRPHIGPVPGSVAIGDRAVGPGLRSDRRRPSRPRAVPAAWLPGGHVRPLRRPRHHGSTGRSCPRNECGTSYTHMMVSK